MATYKEIQAFVREKYGFTVKTCWIADMKKICGLSDRVAPNRISLTEKTNPCPHEKRAAIMDAFSFFKMIK